MNYRHLKIYLINSIFYKFFKFAIVGIFGLVFESTLLFVLIFIIDQNPLVLRIISLPIVIFATWYLNRRFTFNNKNPKIFNQLFTYYFFIFLGIIINYYIFYLTINYFPGIKYNYILALCFGSLSSMGVNFSSMIFIVFKDKSTK